MPSSQFTIYTSSDPQGPGPMNGATGSLINVLDYVLVGGYGTGSYFKQGAGWSKPLTNVSGTLNGPSLLAAYKQASGSKLSLFVNDAGANATSLGKEAWICGFELITSLTNPTSGSGFVYSGSYGNGFGFGQFPFPGQQLNSGHVVWRKSSVTDTTPRQWVIAADASTMYLWVLTLDSTTYYHGMFGDIFSLRGTNDIYRCLIMGRSTENSTVILNSDFTGLIATGASIGGGSSGGTSLGTAMPGCWIARSMSGTGGSTGITKKGDPTTTSAVDQSTADTTSMTGVLQTPNGSDNSIYITPLQIIEPSGICYRGRMRGIYQINHPIANFTDGQNITAGGDYSGKTLMVIKPTTDGLGLWLLETSNTVETN